jgi:hypothetical protein
MRPRTDTPLNLCSLSVNGSHQNYSHQLTYGNDAINSLPLGMPHASEATAFGRRFLTCRPPTSATTRRLFPSRPLSPAARSLLCKASVCLPLFLNTSTAAYNTDIADNLSITLENWRSAPGSDCTTSVSQHHSIKSLKQPRAMWS